VAGIDNFTPKARQVLSLAQKEAERLRKPQISTEHLLIALIEMDGSVASRVLRELGLESENVKEIVEKEIGLKRLLRRKSALVTIQGRAPSPPGCSR